MSIKEFLFAGTVGLVMWAGLIWGVWRSPDTTPQCSIAEFSPDVPLATKQFCRHLRRAK